MIIIFIIIPHSYTRKMFDLKTARARNAARE